MFDFDGSKPKVTQNEFKQKVRGNLYNKGFTHKELDQLEGFLGGDMHEGRSMDKGVDAKEIERGVEWLRGNKHSHSFSDKQIDHIDEELRRHL